MPATYYSGIDLGTTIQGINRSNSISYNKMFSQNTMPMNKKSPQKQNTPHSTNTNPNGGKHSNGKTEIDPNMIYYVLGAGIIGFMFFA